MIRCSLNSEELLSGVHAALAPRVWAELRMIPGQRKRNGFQSSPVLETLQIDGVSCKLDAHVRYALPVPHSKCALQVRCSDTVTWSYEGCR